MNINTNSIFKSILPFAVIGLLAYLLSVALYFYLPKSYSFEPSKQNYKVEYKKYKLAQSFKEKVEKTTKKETAPKKKEYQLISSIVLKAIYAKNDNKGWIIISEKSASVTHILSVGESFKKYTLKSVYPKYVIFEKNSKEYKLTLGKEEKETAYTVKKEPKTKIVKKEIENIDGVYNITKNTVDKYISNPDKIWSQIAINEKMTNGKIDGFEIRNIPSNSIFKKLGLKKGDIIKQVNNTELKSYADAFDIYKKIDSLDVLNFTILRGNKQMEIEYEIK
ncbi:MAG: hypothetical protein U9Q04_08755 [Campylobacterota bacterium]|nr:hypothetical protein [Campylobacterota bacterium]